MPFLLNFELMLLNDDAPFPFLTLKSNSFDCELSGETYDIPRYFRTDGSSVPMAVAALPVVGPLLVMSFFGQGVWKGFEEGILHDWLRRPDRITGKPPVPAHLAHKIFRFALYEKGYPPAMCELYYQAVLRFNS